MSPFSLIFLELSLNKEVSRYAFLPYFWAFFGVFKLIWAFFSIFKAKKDHAGWILGNHVVVAPIRRIMGAVNEKWFVSQKSGLAEKEHLLTKKVHLLTEKVHLLIT